MSQLVGHPIEHPRRLQLTTADIAALGTTVSAQPVPTSPAEGTDRLLDEPGTIVVTAQKRTELLKDVPVAVTGDQLVGDFWTSASDLSRVAPIVTFTEGLSPGTSSIRLRGIGTSVFDQDVETTASGIVDGVVLTRNS